MGKSCDHCFVRKNEVNKLQPSHPIPAQQVEETEVDYKGLSKSVVHHVSCMMQVLIAAVNGVTSVKFSCE